MNEIRAKPFLIECVKFFMSAMSPRHKYGTFALILAVLAFLLSIFSTGATWATVDDKSTVIEDESFFDNLTIEVALQGDLQLTEMDSEVEVTIFFEGSDEPLEEQKFRESEPYEELAEKSTGDMRDTFEDMDTAGTVAQWMIWLGIIAMLLTAVFAFCSLAQITNSRFTTYSGSAATFLLFFARDHVHAFVDASVGASVGDFVYAFANDVADSNIIVDVFIDASADAFVDACACFACMVFRGCFSVAAFQ